jgi:hypothetical protein
MSLIEINWSPSDRQLRQFGWLCLIVLPLLGWWWRASPTWLAILFSLACLVVALAYLQPRVVRPLFVGIILLAAPIGMLTGELAMLLIYFAIFLPISLAFRLARRDALQLRIDRKAASYWQGKTEPKDVASYYRRY